MAEAKAFLLNYSGKFKQTNKQTNKQTKNER